jgi:hypothetical protein
MMMILPNGREAAAKTISGWGPHPSDRCLTPAEETMRTPKKPTSNAAPEKRNFHRFILSFFLFFFLLIETNAQEFFPFSFSL